MSRFAILALTIVAAVFICQVAAEDQPKPECPANEMWHLCGRDCEGTCAKPEGCLVHCLNGSPGGCKCQSGYVRNPKNDQCTLQKDCE